MQPVVPSTYLLTGAAGFIGARTAELLLAAGHHVVGVDNLNAYYDVRLKDHRLHRLLQGDGSRVGSAPDASAFAVGESRAGNFTFVPMDIEDPAAVAALFERWQFDAVINLAARAGVRYSVEHPEVYASTNVSGGVNLLQAMARTGVKKYVLASSSSLYAGAMPPFSETDDVTRPLSPYAASKLGAEAMACAFHHMHDIDATVLRYFTVYGPAGRPDMSPFRFIKWIDEGTPIELFGDGSQTRDFTFVDDIAAGTIAALRPVGYDVVNLGGGNEPMAINRMIQGFERALNKSAVIDRKPFHLGDMRNTQADVSKAARLLNWTPQVKPEVGFDRTVAWYEANRSWLKDIQL
ncbi:NAD-dependent epimerase/dehydratase family protein [Synoicihabitans lomoniglobus]|uniref:NAD-dependent epimerase/dehydratase family protein n=1 Tax=Synoicihabitans lomoniglobus TaxID=2909285 RepID=A0AAF0CQS7_9BACT|nr:NAD-dependent epimerase/dehydratase family protein [Opitutaceae bacterium LMO-M01]WED66333.1 NAD-dependent epimerase/dehydratase family protein [Opitutaceae bacterium LMO-M01]